VPLPGANVQLIAGSSHWTATPTWLREANTDADGSFAVISDERQGEEKIRLSVTTGPLRRRVVLQFGRGAGCDFGALDVAVVDVGHVALGPAGLVTGRLVDGHGMAIAEAWIDLAEDHARSDPAGRFRCEHVPLGPQSVQIGAAGFLVREVACELAAGQMLDLGDLVLVTAPRVTGVVTDLDGRPLPGARVSTAGSTARCPTMAPPT
jgi:hypothetical protein